MKMGVFRLGLMLALQQAEEEKWKYNDPRPHTRLQKTPRTFST